MALETYSQINLLGIQDNIAVGLSGETGISLEYSPGMDVRMSPYHFHDTYISSVSRILTTVPSGYSVTFEAEIVQEQSLRDDEESIDINPIIKKILDEKRDSMFNRSKTVKYKAHVWKSANDPLKKSLFSSFINKKERRTSSQNLLRNCSEVQDIAASLQSSLSAINVKSRILNDSEIKNHLWKILSPSKSRYLNFLEKPEFSLRSQLILSNVKESNKNVYIDGAYHAYISFHTYPDELRLGAIDSLLETLPVGSRYLLGIEIPDQEHFLDQLKKSHTRANSLITDAKTKDFESEARYGDLDEIITRCRNEGERIYYAWAGIVLRHENEDVLNQWKSDLLFSMREIIGGNGLEEDCNHKTCFLSTLPLNGHLNSRKYIFLGSSLAGMVPLSHPWKGHGKGALTMSTPSRETIAMDIYEGGTPRHGIIVSSTGSGKSFMANIMLMGMLADPKARVMIIDVGGSYRRITEIVGGTYFDIKIDERYAINPMLPRESLFDETGTLDSEMLASQTSLIARIAKVTSGPGRLILEKAIEKVYQNINEPLLGDLYKIIKNGSWDETLKPHVQGILNELMQFTEGVYAKIFSSQTKIRPFEKQLTVFDMAGLKDHKDLQSALIGVIAFSLNRKLDDKSIKKLIVIDEGWELFADPAAADLISKLYRQARKQNAAIFSISQSPKEFLSSPVSTAIMANIYWVMALKMSTGHEELSQFGFSDQAIDRARSLQMVPRSYSEVLIRFGDSPNRIARISPTSLEYWIATTNAVETSKESNYRSDNKVTAIESIQHMAEKEPVLPW